MNISRRTVLKNIGVAAAVGFSAAAPSKHVHADDETPHLEVKDPAAVALSYVEHATQKDASCENCLQLQGKPGNNYRPCSLFPGKLVSVDGWCKGWTAEM